MIKQRKTKLKSSAKAIVPARRSWLRLWMKPTLGLLSGCIVIPLRMMTSHYAGAAFAGDAFFRSSAAASLRAASCCSRIIS